MRQTKSVLPSRSARTCVAFGGWTTLSVPYGMMLWRKLLNRSSKDGVSFSRRAAVFPNVGISPLLTHLLITHPEGRNGGAQDSPDLNIQTAGLHTVSTIVGESCT